MGEHENEHFDDDVDLDDDVDVDDDVDLDDDVDVDVTIAVQSQPGRRKSMSVEYTSMMEVILDNASEDHEELPEEDDLVRTSDFE